MTTTTIPEALDRLILDCADCSEMLKYVVSGNAYDFYLERYPGEPYRCPTHRLQHDPLADLYGARRRVEVTR